MSAREWKPGSMARTERGGTVARTARDTWVLLDDGHKITLDEEPRPLVVIDPRNGDEIDRLREILREGLALRSRANLADALTAFVTPPKPDEPTGLGAVVEDATGEHWIRAARIKHGWHRPMGTWAAYADISAVKVLSEGVTP